MLLLFVLCLFILPPTFAQNQKWPSIETLETELSKAVDDSTRIEKLLQLATSTYRKEQDRANAYCERAIELADQHIGNNDRPTLFKAKKSKALGYMGNNYRLLGNLSKSKELSLSSLTLKEEINDRKSMPMVLNTLAMVYRTEGNNFEAINYYKRALKICEEENDKKFTAITSNNLGYMYVHSSRFPEALKYYLKALKINEETGYKKGVSINLNHIGLVYKAQKNYDKAIEYYEKSIEVSKENRDTISISISMYSIGEIYQENEEYEKALVYFKNSIGFREQVGDLTGSASSFRNIGFISQAKKEYRNALTAFEKELSIRTSMSDQRGIASSKNNIANVYLLLKSYNEALQYAKEAESIGKGTKINAICETACEIQSKAYESLGQFKNAFIAQKKYLEKARIIRNSKNVDELTRIEMQYKFDQQIYLDSLQRTEADALVQLEQKEKELSLRKRMFVLYGLIAALGIGGLFFYQRTKNTQRVNQQKTELALQLQKAEAAKLREIDSIKSNFFANISHEFRTPLSLIMGPLKDMQKGSFKGDYKRYFGIMHRNAERLLHLINELLALSKLESGKLKLRLNEDDIIKPIKVLAHSFESMADRKQISYKIEIPNEEIICYYDRNKLEKILINLLSNAFKYTLEEGDVLFNVTYDAKEIMIKIEDTGIGIDKDSLSHIFDRFYQVDETVVSEFGNSGIGLALTKELVNLHKGTIDVESTQGKGSTFIVRLPLTKEAYANNIQVIDKDVDQDNQELFQSNIQPAIPSVNQPSTATLLDNSKTEILVVEDNADLREYISEQFKDNYKVINAQNGKEGIKMAVDHIPDLIITDIMMPDTDGFQLCEYLKNNACTSHIPIIMLTAKADEAEKIKGLTTGADDYLTKPFNTDELKIRVNNLIQSRNKLRERFIENGQLKLKRVDVQSVDEKFIQKILNAIEQNIENEMYGVEELANDLNLSRSQLHRKLKALTNKSPSIFIRTVRLERGKELLEQRAGNASEVSYMVGFSSLSYFSRCFKEQYGISPSDI